MVNDGPRKAAVFLGDLLDPWARALAGALPPECLKIDTRGNLPERLSEEVIQGRTVVVHRSHLSSADQERLIWGRRSGAFRRVILCVGPLVRHHHLERLIGFVEAILPETTAVEVIERYLEPVDAKGRDRSRVDLRHVWVASGLAEVRSMVVEVCQQAGYPAEGESTLGEAGGVGLTVWDVPQLDAAWPEALEDAQGRREVVCVGGFNDRGLVRKMRRMGASACLDWPCDPRDLIYVLDRLSPIEASELLERGWLQGPHGPAMRRGRSSR